MEGGEERWSNLFAVLLEEARRIHAIGDGTANDGEPVEDDRRLVGIFEEDLLGNIDDDGQNQEGEHRDTDLRASAELLEVVNGLGRHLVDKTHGNVGEVQCRGQSCRGLTKTE